MEQYIVRVCNKDILFFCVLVQPSEASDTKIQLPGMEEEVSSLKS